MNGYQSVSRIISEAGKILLLTKQGGIDYEIKEKEDIRWRFGGCHNR